jgi:hypothetical protein
MAGLQGAAEFKARLKNVRKAVGQPGGKAWAKECAAIMTDRVGAMSMPYSGTGRGKYGSRDHPEYILKNSFRVRAGRMTAGSLSSYTVVGSFHAFFVDHGVKAHSLRRRAKGQDRTVFAKRHPGYRARPFRREAALEALRRRPFVMQVIEAWNEAA